MASAHLVEIIKPQEATPSLEQLVDAENSDRLVIYNSVAEKNKAPLSDVQKLYPRRIQADAPAGTPIQSFNESSGSYEWKIK